MSDRTSDPTGDHQWYLGKMSVYKMLIGLPDECPFGMVMMGTSKMSVSLWTDGWSTE